MTSQTHSCVSDADCDDGVFCNGQESCFEGTCHENLHPCEAIDNGLVLCDETQHRCYQCNSDSECVGGQRCMNRVCIGECGGGECRGDGDALCDITIHCKGPDACVYEFLGCPRGERCDPTTGGCVSIGTTCLSQCQYDDANCCSLDSPNCPERPFNDFLNYDSTVADISAQALCDPYVGRGFLPVAGQCADGTKVIRIYSSIDDAYYTTFFDGTTGKFAATTTDLKHGGLVSEACHSRVFWPTRPACDSITVSKVFCSNTYHVGDTVYLDPCISPCSNYGCSSATSDAIPDFETTRADWMAQYPCGDQFPVILAGTCENGTRFLFLSLGLSSDTAFFNPETGKFEAGLGKADLIDSLCCGHSYGPKQIDCLRGTVTEVICGSEFVAGDPIIIGSMIGPCDPFNP